MAKDNKTLYPGDRIPPHKVNTNKQPAIAKAWQVIRNAVPNGGAAKTFSQLQVLVMADPDCQVLSPEDIEEAIGKVMDERSEESQKEYADEE